MVKVVVISDTHNMAQQLDTLPDGDILIHCGDATTRSSLQEVQQFARWFDAQPHPTKLFVPGNHDWMLTNNQGRGIITTLFKKSRVLIADLIEVNGLTIAGVALDYDVRNLPKNLDILITHYPPNGILDEIPPGSRFNKTAYSENIGSNVVLQKVLEVKPAYHFFGHVHEHGMSHRTTEDTIYWNCALLDEHYNLVRKPLVLDIFPRKKE